MGSYKNHLNLFEQCIQFYHNGFRDFEFSL